jgi:hypothetical protein
VTHRSWDVAPLLALGVTLGLLGQLLADTSAGWAGALGLTGFVLLLSGLVRWSRRTRRRMVARDAARRPVSSAA